LAISMEDANLHRGWLTAWGRPGMGAQFRLTVPRRAGGVIESSPLPLVPRDLVLSTLADGIGKPVPALDPAPAVDSEAQRSDPTKLGSGPVAAGSSPASPPPAAPSPVPPSPVSPSPSDAAGAQR